MGLQRTLPPPKVPTVSGNAQMVTAIHCTGSFYVLSHLYAGYSTGQLAVWQVPYEGIEYTKVVHYRAHTGAINCLASTFKHLLSCGDDGILLFIDLESFNIVRRMDVVKEAMVKEIGTRPD